MLEIAGGKLPDTSAAQRLVVFSWLSLTGAAMGLLVGLGEAALLYFVPHVPTLQQPDVRYVIWFLAPLAGLCFFGVLGCLLGLAAAARKPPKPRWNATLVAVMLGAVGAYVVSALRLIHVRQGDLLSPANLATPLVGFGAVTASVLLAVWLGWRHVGRFFDWQTGRFLRPLSRAVILATAVAVTGAATYPARSGSAAGSAQASRPRTTPRPNIVLISLDTVRADHLSAYGYSRRTTPNIDRLAGQGVLFESAMAPSPWTLASHASIFTGLLPHQHGANWSVPLETNFRTLAEVLKARGYETAGFTSNIFYGQHGWGMGQGFDTFEDDSASRRHNLAATLAGRAVAQPFYQQVVRYDLFDRRDAREVNQEIFRWIEHRSNRPFFLFINYFDAHDPYLTGTPFDWRYGQITRALVRQVNSIDGVRVPQPLSVQEQASLIAGYDNCLAFLDEQVGNLVQFLSRSHDWPETIVIITSDHGEGFGEHGRYGHGWNVYREVLHVPLIFVGAGIPSGLRVKHLARIRELFPTVLDLAFGDSLPFRRVSLRRFWMSGFRPESFDDFAISETMENTPEAEPATFVSLMTSEWHYIHQRSGRSELYHWPTDTEEKFNLANSRQHHENLAEMRRRLDEYLRLSVQPWRGSAYLLALDEPGYSFLRALAFTPLLPSRPPDRLLRVGASQTFFAPDPASAPARPVLSDEELMRSLPYQ